MGLLSHASCHQQQQSLLHSLHSEDLGSDRGCHTVEKSFLVKTSPYTLDFCNLILSKSHFDVFLLLSFDFDSFDETFEIEVTLMSESMFSVGLQSSLNQNDVSRRCLFDV